MYLDIINFENVRGLETNKIKFDRNFNLIYGKNGQGKTSLIEAIFFLATGKSFRTKKGKEIINYEKKRLVVFGEYTDKQGEKSIAIDFKENKKYYYNKNKITYSDYVGKMNVISFIPEDIELILGSPSIRRSFFNYEISQINGTYFKNLIEYEKITKIRNKMLKEKKDKDNIFNIYNEKYIEIGSEIIFERIKYVKNISRLLSLNYRKLFDDKSEIKIKYNSFCSGEAKQKEEIKEEFTKKLKLKRNQERRFGYSLVGPQKDDFTFLINDKEAKAYSSQGEKKSIVFSLKISEIDLVYKEKQEMPIFLIDDIGSYFDKKRKESIINYFEQKKIQCFITSTEDLGIEGTKYIIDKGKIVNVENK